MTSGTVYIEAGSKRVFAGAMDWPGWCRSGKDEDSALASLLAYGPRYARAVGSVSPPFAPPGNASRFDVVERLSGNATTDYGAPGVAPASDGRPLGVPELERLTGLLKSCWKTFDLTADAHIGTDLQKGPRGGGRNVTAMVAHVRDAEQAYVSRLGGRFEASEGDDGPDIMAGVRAAMLDALGARARDEPVEMGRRTAPLWVPRFGIRRSAWHALDHAWEIEDRAPRT